MSANATRSRVIGLYKELQRLGRDYPDPSYDYHGRMRKLFENNKHLKTEEEINQAIRLGEFIKQETLALYSLRKYRHLKVSFAEYRVLRPRPPFITPSQRMYPPPDPPKPQQQQQPHTR